MTTFIELLDNVILNIEKRFITHKTVMKRSSNCLLNMKATDNDILRLVELHQGTGILEEITDSVITAEVKFWQRNI